MKWLSGCFLAMSFLLICMCNDPVNPFLNDTEAQAVLYNQSFTDGDSVSIFTTKSLSIVVYFREHVNYYTVHIDDNRLWRIPDSIITNLQLTSTPQLFRFSFSDTGYKEIVVTTHKKSGEKAIERFKLKAVSPLHQDQVIASKGDTVTLQTSSVGDSVTYIWNFRNGETVRSLTPVVQYHVNALFTVAQGELYVTDGTVRSPSFFFPIIDPELPPLAIKYEAEGMAGDTIFTSQTSYMLKVLLNGASTIKRATLNGTAFNVEKGVESDILLKAIIEIPDSHNLSVKMFNVYIQDGNGRVIYDTLYLSYKPEVRSDVEILVMNPADSAMVHDSLIHLYGIVSGRATDSIGVLYAIVNNDTGPVTSHPDRKVWAFDIRLSPGWNTITIGAFRDSLRSGNELASIRHNLYYLPVVMISCVNDSVVGDTVFTGIPFIDFTVHVTTSDQIRSAKVNSFQFDKMQTLDVDQYKFTKYLRDLDSTLYPCKVEVTLQDGKIFTRSFYIRYIEGIVVSKPKLSFLAPVKDSIVTGSTVYRVYGTIERHLQFGTVYLFSSVNGAVSSLYSLVKSDSVWNFVVSLNEGWNEVAVDVHEDSLRSGTSLARSVTAIKLVPELTDSVSPTFVSIMTGNDSELTNGLVSATSSLDLKMMVADNVQPVRVIVNNTLQAHTVDSFYFSSSVPLSHTAGGSISICAYDNGGNKTCVNYKVCYNSSPRFVDIPESGTLFADSVYIFRVRAEDADSDVVTVTVFLKSALGDSILPTNDSGYFSWRPSVNDIGVKMLTIRAEDGFERVVKTIPMYVRGAEAQPIPVKWLTQYQEFKLKYQAKIDTLNQIVAVNKLTGTKPVTFEALLENKPIPISIINGDSIRLKWVPLPEDIGLKTLWVIVKDSLHFSDTLRVTLQIDAPPVIAINWKPSTFSYTEEDTTVQISARLSMASPVKIAIPCLMEWSMSTVSHADIIISDTSYLLFNPGDTNASISLQLRNDDDVEFDEYFSIKFVSLPEYVRVVSGNRFTGTIIDDDRVSYSFERSGASSTEALTQRAFAIVLSKAVPYEVVIQCSVDTSSTADSSDFSLLTRTVTFTPYNTRGDVRLSFVNDNLFENNETVVIKITSQSKNTIPGAITTYTYTIENDDFQAAIVSFSGINRVQINEWVQSGVPLTVTLSRALGIPLTVGYSINPMSGATINRDYSLSPMNSIIFNPGVTNATIVVTPIDDKLFERDEWFQINLHSVSNPNMAKIGSPSSKIVNINDHEG